MVNYKEVEEDYKVVKEFDLMNFTEELTMFPMTVTKEQLAEFYIGDQFFYDVKGKEKVTLSMNLDVKDIDTLFFNMVFTSESGSVNTYTHNVGPFDIKFMIMESMNLGADIRNSMEFSNFINRLLSYITKDGLYYLPYGCRFPCIALVFNKDNTIVNSIYECITFNEEEGLQFSERIEINSFDENEGKMIAYLPKFNQSFAFHKNGKISELDSPEYDMRSLLDGGRGLSKEGKRDYYYQTIYQAIKRDSNKKKHDDKFAGIKFD